MANQEIPMTPEIAAKLKNIDFAEKTGQTGSQPKEAAQRKKPDLPVHDIKALRAASNAAIKAKDVTAIIAMMAQDIVLVSGDSQKMAGLEQVREAFEAQFKAYPDAVYVRTPKSVKVSQNGMLAYEEGEWQGAWSEPRGRMQSAGRYSAGWRKHGEDWKLHTELFVTLTFKEPSS